MEGDKMRQAGALAGLRWTLSTVVRWPGIEVRAWLLTCLGVAAFLLSAVRAQEAVPEQWIVYAQMAGNVLQERFAEGESYPVARLHAWLERRQEMIDEPLGIVVRIWISPSGQVERSEFGSLGDAQADADLRTVLGASPLPAPPPPDMRQPLVLRLSLQPDSDYAGGGF